MSTNHSSLLVLGLAIALSAVGAAVTTSLILAPDSGDPGRDDPVVEAARDALARSVVLGQIEELQRENEELRERLALVESRPVANVRTPGDSVSKADFEAFKEEVRESLASRKLPLLPAAELKDHCNSYTEPHVTVGPL